MERAAEVERKMHRESSRIMSSAFVMSKRLATIAESTHRIHLDAVKAQPSDLARLKSGLQRSLNSTAC